MRVIVKTETRVGIFVIISIGIFFYLSLNIGAIRLDKKQYYTYKTYFDDTGGLDEKSQVKIAGVEVGWVDEIKLLSGGKAEVVLKLHKRNKISRNAYATIQQEGLIGTKNIDIEPGDPTTGILPPGSVLSIPGRAPTSVGDLLDQFKDIAGGIQDVVTSFKNTFGTSKGEDQLQVALDSVAKASTRIADFSQVLQRTLNKNEENINSMLGDFQKTAFSLQKDIPELTRSLKDDVFPSFQKGADRITVAMADDTLPKASSAFESLEGGADEAKKTFQEATEVVEKINEGKGVLGKLINEDETYGDIKKTVRGFKNMVSKSEMIDIIIDMHSESLFKTHNGKGYFEVKLRPQSDYFYNIQLVSSERGSVRRTERFYQRYDNNGNLLNSDNFANDYEKARAPDKEHKTIQFKNDMLFGFQFGKRFDRVALRMGMFENTFGFGCDYYIPLHTDKLHWITSFEAFDLSGYNRVEKGRPHLKWMNKIYFMKNLYTTFGIDDFVSKTNSSPFWGGGVRFGDDDIKHLLKFLPTGGMGKK